MIKSMTGFGRYEIVNENRKLTVELKSVNHRYLDINIRLPRNFNMFESAIRNLLKTQLQRGKVDVFIFYEDETPENVLLKYNRKLAEEYVGIFRQMATDFQIENDIKVSHLSKYPEVLIMEEQQINEEMVWELLEEGLTLAMKSLLENRLLEGGNLKIDLFQKLNQMLVDIEEIERRGPKLILEYRKKLENKISEVLKDTTLDENKLAAEVVLYTDKISTDEEIVRLKSHVNHMIQVLEEGTSIGRKLDFITQEMNREANTVLSKANDLETSNLAIELKTEIEKIREQIQNIE